jgi:DNA-binding SARP family transcriptional activator
MEFRILGSLEASEAGREVAVGSGRQRVVLALLLLHPNVVLSRDRLIDALWGERPPPTAANMLHNYVSQLRHALGREGASALETHGNGYLLRVERGERDLDRFEELLGRGRDLRTEDPKVAAEVLREALALWRGPPLADFTYEDFAREEIGRLEELRLMALEERIDADLALGRHADLVAELTSLVEEHPLRERLRAQLMLALYRCGRQAEALEVYQAARRALLEERGLEPGAALRELEAGILRKDPELGAQSGFGAPLLRRRRGGLLIAAAGGALLAVGAVLYKTLLTPTGGAYGGEVNLSAPGFSITGLISDTWQFYFPKLPLMELRSGPHYGYRQVFIEGFFGRFGSLEVNYAPGIYDLIQDVCAIGLAGLIAAIIARWSAIRARWPQVAVLVAMTVSLLALLHVASYRALRTGSDPLITGRYLLPLVTIFGLTVAFVVSSLRPRLSAALGTLVLAGLLALNLGGIMLTLTRFYG